MTTTSAIALFFALVLSSAIPGPSVLTVVSRSISHGWQQGLLVVLGVLTADYIFIFLALSGLSAVSVIMGEFAAIIKYIGIGYLFWLAYQTWNSPVTDSDEQAVHGKAAQGRDKASSLLTGTLVTLANPKAILFYMGFFPAFVDVTSVTAEGIITILLISTVAVGGVLGFYACLASKSRFVFKGRKARQWLNKLSGSFLASCGVVLATKS